MKRKITMCVYKPTVKKAVAKEDMELPPSRLSKLSFVDFKRSLGKPVFMKLLWR